MRTTEVVIEVTTTTKVIIIVIIIMIIITIIILVIVMIGMLKWLKDRMTDWKRKRLWLEQEIGQLYTQKYILLRVTSTIRKIV